MIFSPSLWAGGKIKASALWFNFCTSFLDMKFQLIKKTCKYCWRWNSLLNPRWWKLRATSQKNSLKTQQYDLYLTPSIFCICYLWVNDLMVEIKDLRMRMIKIRKIILICIWNIKINESSWRQIVKDKNQQYFELATFWTPLISRCI